jgi:hypothetical protein
MNQTRPLSLLAALTAITAGYVLATELVKARFFKRHASTIAAPPASPAMPVGASS